MWRKAIVIAVCLLGLFVIAAVFFPYFVQARHYSGPGIIRKAQLIDADGKPYRNEFVLLGLRGHEGLTGRRTDQEGRLDIDPNKLYVDGIRGFVPHGGSRGGYRLYWQLKPDGSMAWEPPPEIRPEDQPVTSVQLERTPCYGTCPVYSVTLRPDGTLTYKGREFVKHVGSWTASFSPRDFSSLVHLVLTEGADSYKDSYGTPADDIPSHILTIKRPLGAKVIWESGDRAPDGMHRIMERIDLIVDGATNWKASESRTQAR